MDKNKTKNYVAFALLIGALGIAIIQIVNANSTTKTESALFNILQFVFSVGFSWIISSYFSELSFLDSQKKFAIGAFRRIKEIERSIGRAQHLLTSDKSKSDGKNEYNHEAVMMSLLSAQDAVNSSVADWGDIIGDEIKLTKEIERLKGLRKSADKFEREYLDNLRVINNDKEIFKKLAELRAELPTSLRVEEESDAYQYELATKILDEEVENTGEISLSGLWEEGDSFAGDLSNVTTGDTLFIAKGYTDNRPNVLMVFDKDNKWVGIITNKLIQAHDDINMNYSEFLEFFEDYINYCLIPAQFGGTPLPITITEIHKVNEHGYQHFDATLSMSDIPRKPNKQIQPTANVSAN